MTTKTKNILIVLLVTVLLSTFIFVMFFLDDSSDFISKTEKSNVELFDEALYNWNKDCENKYEFFHFVNQFDQLPRGDAPEEIENFPIPIGDIVIHTTLTYKATYCIERVFMYDYYTTDDDRIYEIAIDRNTGVCAEIRYNNKAVKVDQTENQYKNIIKTAYECYDYLRENAEKIDWDRYTMQIDTAQNISCITYRKYLPYCVLAMSSTNQSCATADCAYIYCTENDGEWYLESIRFGNIGMIQSDIVAYKGNPSIKNISNALNISAEISKEVLISKTLYHEFMYINGEFFSRWSGGALVYLPANVEFITQNDTD